MDAINQNPTTNQPQQNIQTVEPVSNEQKDPGVAYVQSLEDSSTKPFYKEWTFWVLITLVLILIGVVFYMLFPNAGASLDAEIVSSGDIAKLHVKKLNAPTAGFLVVQADENGVPGVIIAKSPYLVADEYSDFFVPFVTDDPTSNAIYKELSTSGSFFVSFYTYPTSENFIIDGNIKVAKDNLGKTLQIKFIDGKAIIR